MTVRSVFFFFFLFSSSFGALVPSLEKSLLASLASRKLLNRFRTVPPVEDNIYQTTPDPRMDRGAPGTLNTASLLGPWIRMYLCFVAILLTLGIFNENGRPDILVSER